MLGACEPIDESKEYAQEQTVVEIQESDELAEEESTFTLQRPTAEKYHAEYNGSIFYRKYSSADYAKQWTGYDQFSKPVSDGVVHELYKMNAAGESELYVKDDPGVGEMYVACDKLFLVKKIQVGEASSKSELYYYDLNTNERQDLPAYGSLYGTYGDYIFVEKNGQNTICILDADSCKEITSVDGNYLGADQDGVYSYTGTLCSTYDLESESLVYRFGYGVKVYRTDYNGKQIELVNMDEDFFRARGMLDSESAGMNLGAGDKISCLQTVGDKVIFNYASYDGSASIFSVGYLCAVDKDGSNLLFFEDVPGDVFYCTQKESNINVYMTDYFSSEIYTYTIQGKEEPLKDYCNQKYGYPEVLNKYFSGQFPEGCDIGDVTIYEDASGKVLKLIDHKDYEPFGYQYGIREEGDDSYTTSIDDIEHLGDKVFFTISVKQHDPENDIGWRWAYKILESVEFVKDLKTGEVKQLFIYE